MASVLLLKISCPYIKTYFWTLFCWSVDLTWVAILKSNKVSFLNFFFQNCHTVFDPLCFHMNLRFSFWIYVRNDIVLIMYIINISPLLIICIGGVFSLFMVCSLIFLKLSWSTELLNFTVVQFISLSFLISASFAVIKKILLSCKIMNMFSFCSFWSHYFGLHMCLSSCSWILFC